MTTDWIDQPTPVREGEALDAERLGAYLRNEFPELTEAPVITQFGRGYSNLTYLVQVGERALVLRRPPLGVKIKSAHDMGREYTILSHLHPVYPKVPRPLAHCTDEAVLGAPFYLMERVEGIILRPTMPEGMIPAPALMGRIAGSLIDNLAELHAVDYEAAGLGSLGRPAGYVERQIKGWSRRYQQSRTDEIPEMERVAAWLAEQLPPETGAALIHNDYKYDNVILDPADWSRIIAVLDWEMATLGDPLMDLGSALGYWVEAGDPELMRTLRLSPTDLPGNPTREAVVERYARASGRDVSNIVFYFVYGLFKVAVIVQQLYRRYKMGLTQEPRYARLIDQVRLSSQAAVRAIEKQRIDRLFE